MSETDESSRAIPQWRMILDLLKTTTILHLRVIILESILKRSTHKSGLLDGIEFTDLELRNLVEESSAFALQSFPSQLRDALLDEDEGIIDVLMGLAKSWTASPPGDAARGE